MKNCEDLEKATKEKLKIMDKIDNNAYWINKKDEGLKDVFVYVEIEQNFNNLRRRTSSL